ncbi:MAG: Gfo/Idh/MocA family oxidoreductase [Thermoleophilaceae bacterium]
MTLRAGVIGLGVGEQHADAYAAHPQAEVAALCDLDEAKLNAVGERHPGARLTASAEELLADDAIDIVSVASFDSFHHEQVKRAIERGKHVFVEKPLCQHEWEARELAEALQAQPGLVLSSNLLLRVSPRFEQVKRWVEQDRFGRIYFLEGAYDYGRLWKLTEGWRGDLDHYSVTLGGTVHVVDLLLWLTGDRVKSVTARGNRIASEGTKFRFDDLVAATLELESGAVAQVTANFGGVHPHYHEVEVWGTQATFVNGLESGTLWTEGADGAVPEAVDTPYPGVRKGDLVASFVDAAAGGGPPIVTAAEVFEVMAVCFAIDRAAASGETVEPERFG